MSHDESPGSYLRAMSELSRGRPEAAVEHLRVYLGANPNNAGGHSTLALALVSSKRRYAARYEADLGRSLAPDDALSHYASGRVALAEGAFERAEQDFREAIRLDPEEPAYRVDLASALGLRDRRSEARVVLEEALALDPEGTGAMVALADLHRKEGRLLPALRLAQDARRIEPESVEVLVLWGRLALDRGKLEEAQDHAMWALRLNADDPGALLFLVELEAHRSRLLGAWWRFQTWISRRDEKRQILLLSVMWLVMRVLTLAAGDLGWPGLASGVLWGWLAFCVYTWFAPVLFARMLAKKLERFRLKEDF